MKGRYRFFSRKTISSSGFIMYMNYDEIGKRIAEIRKKQGLKQNEVCEMAGLSDKYLSNVERATSVMSIDVLMRICNALNVSPNEILMGTQKDTSSPDYAEFVVEKLKNMDDWKIKTVLNFIDWIEQQNINSTDSTNKY